MKSLLPVLALAVFAILHACSKDNKPNPGSGDDCCSTTCWRGSLDTTTCSCNCGAGYGGPECDSLLFSQGAGLRFDTHIMDYMKTAAAEDVIEQDCILHLRKGTNQTRSFHFKNISAQPILFKTAKGSCGCLVPTYPKEPIAPGESGVIQVSYDTNRIGEKLTHVELLTNEGEYRLMVKARVIE